MSIAYRPEQYPDACGDVNVRLLAAERVLYVEGDLNVSRRWFEAAYQTAEQVGDRLAMARAAVGLGGVWVNEHRMAGEAAMVTARQRRVLAAVDPRSPLGVRLRVRLCAEEDYRLGEHASVLRMLIEARNTGDPVTIAEALNLAHCCLLDPQHQTLRLELAQEMIGQAAWTNRRGDLLVGLLWRTVNLFLGADPNAERSLGELRDQLALKDHLAVSFVVSAIEVMLAIREGRFAEAEALTAECARRGHLAGDHDANGWHGTQMMAIRWYQGRVAELVPILAELVHHPALGVNDYDSFAALAVAAAAAGDQRLARGMLARLCGTDLASLPRGKNWLAALHGMAEAAHLLDDADTAAQVYDLLKPFAHLPMIASVGVACFGSVHLALGTAALTAGQPDRAVEHLRQAVPANLALSHWPAAVLSRWRLGHALRTRHGSRDETAEAELAMAEQEAAELGMVLPAPLTSHTVRPAVDPTTLVCRRRGRKWQLQMGDRSVLVDDSVGMRHLSVLLAHPGWEIRAVDLVAGPALPEEVAGDGGSASAQPMLDDQAKKAYKERLNRLQVEIADLQAAGEFERAEVLRGERDWLLTSLKAATCLGGRARRFADAQERARIAVGKAIRRAVNHIAQIDPNIADKLRATVRTGQRCCYQPGGRSPAAGRAT